MTIGGGLVLKSDDIDVRYIIQNVLLVEFESELELELHASHSAFD